MMNIILSDYLIAAAELGETSVNLVNYVMECHLEQSVWKERRQQCVLHIIGQLHQIFYRFAERSCMFKSLTNGDQLILLRKNDSLYVQYILSCYLTADTGMEQLAWLLGPNMPILGTRTGVNILFWGATCRGPTHLS